MSSFFGRSLHSRCLTLKVHKYQLVSRMVALEKFENREICSATIPPQNMFYCIFVTNYGKIGKFTEFSPSSFDKISNFLNFWISTANLFILLKNDSFLVFNENLIFLCLMKIYKPIIRIFQHARYLVLKGSKKNLTP